MSQYSELRQALQPHLGWNKARVIDTVLKSLTPRDPFSSQGLLICTNVEFGTVFTNPSIAVRVRLFTHPPSHSQRKHRATMILLRI
jgi:hypothetical protein